MAKKPIDTLLCYHLIQFSGGRYDILPLQDDPLALDTPADVVGLVLFKIDPFRRHVRIIMDYGSLVINSNKDPAAETEHRAAYAAIFKKACTRFRSFSVSPRPR
jgi:hypothetical protein